MSQSCLDTSCVDHTNVFRPSIHYYWHNLHPPHENRQNIDIGEGQTHRYICCWHGNRCSVHLAVHSHILQTDLRLIERDTTEKDKMLSGLSSGKHRRYRGWRYIIESAEALPILCVRYFRWEREREIQTERERRKWRHHCRAKIGDEFTLSLAKNSHNWRWAYTFPCQKFALFVSPFTLPVSPFA